MPSKKQRRRREKSRRHDYEYVYLDEEGHEVEVDPDNLPQPARRDGAGARTVRTTRGGRKIQPPSWSRVGKRGLLFAPLMFITVSFLSHGLTVAQRVYQTVFLLAFFLPFSYLMDTFAYKTYRKRMDRNS